MEERLVLLDINTATRAELKNLPGIGGALADKLIEARPFFSMEDLLRVRGMKPDLLELLREYAVVVPMEGTEPPSPDFEEPQNEIQAELPVEEEAVMIVPEEAEGEAKGAIPVVILPSDEPLAAAPLFDEKPEDPDEADPPPPVEPVFEQPPAASPVFPKPAPQLPAFVTRSQLVGAVIGAMIFSSLLSILLVLVFLAALNGGLRYSSQADLRQTSADLASLKSQLVGLESDLDSIDQRLMGVEGLDTRITHVEGDFDQLRTEFQSAQAEVQSMTGQVEDLTLQVDALVARTGRFQKFLDGLSGLLENLTQPVLP